MMEWNGMEDKLTMVVTETFKCHITSCCRVYRFLLLLLLLDFIYNVLMSRPRLSHVQSTVWRSDSKTSVGRLNVTATVTVPKQVCKKTDVMRFCWIGQCQRATIAISLYCALSTTLRHVTAMTNFYYFTHSFIRLSDVMGTDKCVLL